MAERGGGGQIYPFLKNSLGFFPEKVRKGEGNTDVRNTVEGGVVLHGPPTRHRAHNLAQALTENQTFNPSIHGMMPSEVSNTGWSDVSHCESQYHSRPHTKPTA